MKWLVTGAAGQLGSDVVAAFRLPANRFFRDEVVALDRHQLDIGDEDAVASAVTNHRPDVIVNCAAYTAVDAAESDMETAALINGYGPRLLAQAASSVGARMIHVSTDYVFDGTATSPILETEETSAVSAYGQTKEYGEREVLKADGDMYVVRTAWVYGAVGTNFVKTIARLAMERGHVDVVDDQRGSPTWSLDLALALLSLGRVSTDQCPPGIWHVTGGGETTWFGFAREIVRLLGLDESTVSPVSSSAFVRPAPRPAYSVLSDSKWIAAGMPPMRPWDEALKEAIDRVVSS